MPYKIAFQSIGGVEGIYLPSKNNPHHGTLLTEFGMFPADTSKQVRRTFPRFAGHGFADPDHQTRLKFLAWLRGNKNPPFYSFDLRSIHHQFPQWIAGDNWFYLQGIIYERTSDIVSVKMQRNYWQDYKKEVIAASVNYIKIKDCPPHVRRSQFWKFTVCFRDNFLHCLTGEKLADAPTTKKIIKSWQSNPLPASQYKTALKR